jgi:hypothetical protein
MIKQFEHLKMVLGIRWLKTIQNWAQILSDLTPFEYTNIRTVRFFWIQFYASPGHSNIGPFENWTKKSGFRIASIDSFGMNKIFVMTLFL